MSSTLSFLNFQHGVSRKSPSFGQNLAPTKDQYQRQRQRQRQRQSPSGTSSSITFQPSVEEMRSVFNKFDANKDGKISEEEYQSALRVMGGGGGSSNVGKAAFAAADTDGDGYIDFEEFMRVQKAEGGVKKSEIEGAFRVFDLDGNGKISPEELLQVMTRLGGERSTSLEACRKMVKGVDADGDGLINFNEFMVMMTRTMKLSVV